MASAVPLDLQVDRKANSNPWVEAVPPETIEGGKECLGWWRRWWRSSSRKRTKEENGCQAGRIDAVENRLVANSSRMHAEGMKVEELEIAKPKGMCLDDRWRWIASGKAWDD
jgi:hypothetical protein